MSTTGPDSVLLVVRGRLDAAATGRLRGLLEHEVPRGTTVRLDLSRSAGLPVEALRALAAAHARLRDNGAGLVLGDPSPAAARSLRLSGLHRVLRVETRTAAAGPGRAAGQAAEA